MVADFSGAASFSSSSDMTTKKSRSTSKPRTISSAGTSFAGGFRDAPIANSGMILLVEKVRADALAFSGRVQIDRDMNEPKRDRPFPDGSHIRGNAEVDAIRVLPASLPISILAFVLGWQAHRGFLWSSRCS